MGKKTIVQIFLIVLLLFITFFVFKMYYVSENTEQITSNSSSINSKENITDNDGQNLIQSIKYTSNNTRGDVYEILAEYGEVNSENSDLMYLTKVKGNIIFTNKSQVNLTSDFANFNTRTFETTFIDNVKILKQDQIITGETLYLILDHDDSNSQNNIDKEKNLLRMSRNVVFEKPGYTLKADILEVDLITKNLKIYMKDKTNKVIATSILK